MLTRKTRGRAGGQKEPPLVVNAGCHWGGRHKILSSAPAPSLVQNPQPPGRGQEIHSQRTGQVPLTAPEERADAKAAFPEEKGGTPLGSGLCMNTKQKPIQDMPQPQGSAWLPCRGGAGHQRKLGLQALPKAKACPREQRLQSVVLLNRKQQSPSEKGQEHGERALLWCRDC